MQQFQSHRFSCAPMMDWSDRHCRSLHRVLSRRMLLYSEMVTSGAVLNGDREKLLGFDDGQHPVALQLGGSDPADLAAAAKIGEDFGYDEINLNVGCPSDRVQSGRFGACLMREPALVADCMAAMAAAVSVPVTVKCRIGVDDQDPEQSLFELVDLSAKAGVSTFVVHARKAWLKGLSPKENRDVPPLDYRLVHRLKAQRPDLTIIINGGVPDLDVSLAQLELVDGVMLGRAAYHEPGLLGQVDRRVFGEGRDIDAFEAVELYKPYMAKQLATGVHLAAMSRHMLGLFHGLPGARAWRRILTVEGVGPDAGLNVVDRAAAAVRQAMDAREARFAERIAS
ncbi:tRNA dihydrouridine(20/20a) synthase DusA [Caulobacter sp. DWP3-1-3b2]|uniref:tRNA dihydrouridine(20/20a) synthase DusA n=1 Tax=Caulobacter sp. DWP3-1-3b2 TaxID=2804643 RepID=UPI003CEB1B22